MTPSTYRTFRESLGDPERAARLLGCKAGTIVQRERGTSPVSPAAAARIVEAVHALALKEDVRFEERQWRRLDRERERRAMTPAQFCAVLADLGWDYGQAAHVLLGDDRADRARVANWATGRTAVPWWLAAHLRRELGIGSDDPWPIPAGAKE